MPENIAHQYRTIAETAGWFDCPLRGVVRVDGADRLSFLHALLTNDVLGIAELRGVYAAYLTPQGRMLSDMDVLNSGDSVLLLTSRERAAFLATRLDSLIFAEQVTVTDATADWVELVVVGRAAAEIVASVFDVPVDALGRLCELEQVRGGDAIVFRGATNPLPEFRVLVPATQAGSVIAKFGALDLLRVAPELATAIRIESGRPLWGVDMSEDTIPLEAGLLDRAISTSKGCYVGQEVIIRVLHRGGGRVAKRLVQLVWPSGSADVPAAGTSLVANAEVVGRITSAAFSPARNAVIALGYVQRDLAEPGRELLVGALGSAEVLALAH